MAQVSMSSYSDDAGFRPSQPMTRRAIQLQHPGVESGTWLMRDGVAYAAGTAAPARTSSIHVLHGLRWQGSNAVARV